MTATLGTGDLARMVIAQREAQSDAAYGPFVRARAAGVRKVVEDVLAYYCEGADADDAAAVLDLLRGIEERHAPREVEVDE